MMREMQACGASPRQIAAAMAADGIRTARARAVDSNGRQERAGSGSIDPTIDSQILELQSSGADVLFDASTPKFSAMAIRKVADLDWHPVHIIDSNGALVSPALQSAGFDKSVGVITAQYLKDPTDPQWADDAGMKEFLAWKVKYAPEADISNPVWYYGYTMAQALVVVLKQAGKDLTRESIMNAATPAGHDDAAAGAAGDQDRHLTHRLPGDERHASRPVRRKDVPVAARVAVYCAPPSGSDRPAVFSCRIKRDLQAFQCGFDRVNLKRMPVSYRTYSSGRLARSFLSC